MISIFIKILIYDSEMGKDFVNRFFLGELNKVDYYILLIIIIIIQIKIKIFLILIWLLLLLLNINGNKAIGSPHAAGFEIALITKLTNAFSTICIMVL